MFCSRQRTWCGDEPPPERPFLPALSKTIPDRRSSLHQSNWVIVDTICKRRSYTVKSKTLPERISLFRSNEWERRCERSYVSPFYSLVERSRGKNGKSESWASSEDRNTTSESERKLPYPTESRSLGTRDSSSSPRQMTKSKISEDEALPRQNSKVRFQLPKPFPVSPPSKKRSRKLTSSDTEECPSQSKPESDTETVDILAFRRSSTAVDERKLLEYLTGSYQRSSAHQYDKFKREPRRR